VNRTVTVVLVSPDGTLLGSLPPFEVGTPWWQEIGEIAARGVQVLRLLRGDRLEPPGGHVTYLAEIDDKPAGLDDPPDVDLRRHPKRAPYAEIGGPAASLAWARDVLGPGVTAHQQRTWNLSAIWRMDATDGTPVAWLKQVPAFFAHEPAAIRLVTEIAPGLLPPLIAAGEAGRMLLGHVPGEDGYGAGPELCAEIAAAFHPVQTRLAGLSGGIPDGRLSVDRFARVAAPYLDRFEGLRELIDGLPARFAAIAACGLPDTLVHGDLHSGNVRTDQAGRLTILDWGDCMIGHPAFDIIRLTGGLDDPAPLIDAWAARWARTVPGSDPLRAVDLLRPVAALREATVYAAFLDAIEPAEWPYHAADVPQNLAAAASMVGE
jgi:hypothetical protein